MPAVPLQAVAGRDLFDEVGSAPWSGEPVVRIRVIQHEDVLPLSESESEAPPSLTAQPEEALSEPVCSEQTPAVPALPEESALPGEAGPSLMAGEAVTEPHGSVTEAEAPAADVVAEPVLEAESGPAVLAEVGASELVPEVVTEPPAPVAETEAPVVEVVAEPVLQAEAVVPELIQEVAAEPLAPVAEAEPPVVEVVAEPTLEPGAEPAFLPETATAELVPEVAAEPPAPVAEAEAPVLEVVAEPVAEAEAGPAALPETVAAEPLASVAENEAPLVEVVAEPALQAEPEPAAFAETVAAEPLAPVAQAEAPVVEVVAEPAAGALAQTTPSAEVEVAGAATAVEAPDEESAAGLRPLETAEQPEPRLKVVEMPAHAASRDQRRGELTVPGGFHESVTLARLLEEEDPYRGMAFALSIVDYVRLMAEHGKPAMEQTMAAVTRLVMAMTREQDFACRISEDEFILLFPHETGAAAKRRILMISERIWDFQLRALGTMSVIFGWGAGESDANQTLSQTVDAAREQMIETRRNRKSLIGGAGRFRKLAVNR
jgi:GGDEF domain-containing protein